MRADFIRLAEEGHLAKHAHPSGTNHIDDWRRCGRRFTVVLLHSCAPDVTRMEPLQRAVEHPLEEGVCMWNLLQPAPIMALTTLLRATRAWTQARKNIVSAYQQQLRTMLAQGL